MLAELVRQTGVPPECGVGGSKAEGALAMMHAMQSMYGGTPMDPFIGQCSASSAVVEAHARQNSTDSGLGKCARHVFTITLHCAERCTVLLIYALCKKYAVPRPLSQHRRLSTIKLG